VPRLRARSRRFREPRRVGIPEVRAAATTGAGLAYPAPPGAGLEPLRSDLDRSTTCTMSGNRLRRIVLQQSKRANVGHIGSALSVADILAALYGGVLRIEDPADSERDRFVLSKGHAALALYAALHLRGWLAA